MGSILTWINDRSTETNTQNIKEAINILILLAKGSQKGLNILHKYGSQEFFLEFRKNTKNEIHEDIDTLLKCLVGGVQDDQENDSSLMNSQTQSQFSRMEEYSENGKEVVIISTMKVLSYIFTGLN